MKYYKIDFDKVKTLEDMKKVLTAMDLQVSEPDDEPMESFDSIRPFLTEVEGP